MEAAGLAATCAGLLGALTQLVKFTHKISDAPKGWNRYCALLENLYQLLKAIESLTADMEEPGMLSVTHNDREYGLVAFCVNNAQTALKDAIDLLNKFKQEGNVKLWKVKTLIRSQRKRLLFVLREQDIQGYVQGVETAIAGLGIAIHAASLARTNDAYTENKKAIADLTRQLAETFEKLEKSHEESLDKKEPKTVHLVVTSATRRSRVSRNIPWGRRKRSQESQAGEASPIEVPLQLAAIHEHPRVNTPTDQEKHLEDGSEAVSELSGNHIGHAAEMSLVAFAPSTSPFPNTTYEAQTLGRQANDISITCEDGSVALIPAGAIHEDSHEGREGAETSSPLVKATNKEIGPPSDAEKLLQFLANPPAPDRSPSPHGPTSTRSVKGSVNICTIFEFEFSSLDSEDAEDEQLDTSSFRFLCIERLFLDHRLPGISARRPCHEFPRCNHAKIDQLDGGMSASELFASDMGYIMGAAYDAGPNPQPFRPYRKFEALVYERCAEPCGHTPVQGNKKDTTRSHCMKPLYIIAIIGAFPEDSDTDKNPSSSEEVPSDKEDSGDEVYTSDEGDSDEDYISDEGGSDDRENEGGVQGAGPFFSVPCLFCSKMALGPKAKGVKESESVISYGCRTYAYRCAQCQKTSWITGAREAAVRRHHWFKARDDPESPQ